MSQGNFFYVLYLIYHIILFDVDFDNFYYYYILYLRHKFMICGLMTLESIIGEDKHLNKVCVGKQ